MLELVGKSSTLVQEVTGTLFAGTDISRKDFTSSRFHHMLRLAVPAQVVLKQETQGTRTL